MAGTATEIEAKFLVPDLTVFREHILARGARPQSSRVLERNERFDTPDGRLRQAGAVLRLRQDARAWLTVKRRLETPEERAETEIEVSDADAAHALLDQLGYRVVFTYEKFRETLRLGEAMVVLDELPFGNFVEIEAPSLQSLVRAAAALGLDWDRRLSLTYLDLFDALRERLRLPFADATFSRFSGRAAIQPADLGLEGLAQTGWAHGSAHDPTPE
jgi:adenylate cyclase class 2